MKNIVNGDGLLLLLSLFFLPASFLPSIERNLRCSCFCWAREMSEGGRGDPLRWGKDGQDVVRGHKPILFVLPSYLPRLHALGCPDISVLDSRYSTSGFGCIYTSLYFLMRDKLFRI
ncbi:hypothetical protein B0H34DRAFT_719419 [Crassisporium funariophilum]|nr:hypothetical protein B0H34DRAFT_719419 [Crassisporium funariophilum]